MIAGGKGGNPAVLSVNYMEPVKLAQGLGLALKSVAYGEIYNVSEINNSFKMNVKKSEIENVINSTGGFNVDRDQEAILSIPNGRYNQTEHVMAAIERAINTYIQRIGLQAHCKSLNTHGRMTIIFPNILEISYMSSETPLDLINASVIANRISSYAGDVSEWTELCFVYVNIVQNSFINGRKSRLASVFPVHSKKGYTFFEIGNPSYVPIEIREFTDISVTFRNIKGEILQISDTYDTVITLHVKALEK